MVNGGMSLKSGPPRDEYDGATQLVILGDLHGDVQAARMLLQSTGVIDAEDEWVADPGTVVVQLGDLVDDAKRAPDARCLESHDVDAVAFMQDLGNKAAAHGRRCACVALVGNHELMNALGVFTYVSRESMERSGGALERLCTHRPMGSLAVLMAARMPCVVRVNSVLCTHAGVTISLGRRTIAEMNAILRDFLLGVRTVNDPDVREVLFDKDASLLFTRKLSDPSYRKAVVPHILSRHGCAYMAVGHSVQPVIAVRDNVIFADTGISGAVCGNPQAVVVGFDEKGNVIRANAHTAGSDPMGASL
jgi:hypothetical protein